MKASDMQTITRAASLVSKYRHKPMVDKNWLAVHACWVLETIAKALANRSSSKAYKSAMQDLREIVRNNTVTED